MQRDMPRGADREPVAQARGLALQWLGSPINPAQDRRSCLRLMRALLQPPADQADAKRPDGSPPAKVSRQRNRRKPADTSSASAAA